MYNVIMITYYVSGASGHLGHNVIYEIKSYHQKHLNEDYQIMWAAGPKQYDLIKH